MQMGGQNNFGVSTTTIREKFIQLENHWLTKRNQPNTLIQYHTNPKLIQKNLYLFEKIYRNIKTLNNVAIVHSSFPVVLSHMLYNVCNSKLTLISDHPGFVEARDFFENNYNATTITKSPLFDNINLQEYDLIIIPEYEYFVPLNLLDNFKNKTVALVHHIVHLNEGNDMNDVYSINDLYDKCSFTNIIDSSILNYDKFPIYCIIGNT